MGKRDDIILAEIGIFFIYRLADLLWTLFTFYHVKKMLNVLYVKALNVVTYKLLYSYQSLFTNKIELLLYRVKK